MAKKIKQTRPELKRYRDMLARFERYLPMLKLKQQQLQMTLRQIEKERTQARQEKERAEGKIEPYRTVMRDISGINVAGLSEPERVKTSRTNIAGVSIPVFEEAIFHPPKYSLFATPVWVDQTLLDMREVSRCQAKMTIIDKQHRLLQQELNKISQRVNLFEKVKIPECQEAIRVIRIKLGDEMTAGVARAKIAKTKIVEKEDRQQATSEHAESGV